ncbi:MAG: M48 family metallopeptidase [Candidatus Methylumidiphilus sp.]
MITLDGLFHDGQSSSSISARATVWPEYNCINITGYELEQEYPLNAVKISSRVGNGPRRLTLPDGTSFETRNHAAVDALLRARGGGRWDGFSVHVLESRLRWVFSALLATGLLAWLAVAFGIPYLAERVAYAIPVEMEGQMGAQTLQGLDNLLFAPTALTFKQQDRAKRLFAGLLSEPSNSGARRLEFRAVQGHVANALSLPAGIVVVTDPLVALADTDEQLQAVLAHELGHAHHRHSLRSWLQNSVAALLTTAVLGDVSSVAANVAVLPTLLLESQYSRAFEEEADDFAAQSLHNRGLSSCHLGVILTKLEAAPRDGQSMPGFLSSHPATEERVRRLADMEQEGGLTGLAGCGKK